jgi:hypothetical protein
MVRAPRRRKAPPHIWTVDQIHYLKTNHKFTRASRRDIAAALGLTLGQVSGQIHRMGLVRLSDSRRPWTEDEENRLQNLAGTMPAFRIARELRRSPGSVRGKLAEMGLSARERVDWYTKSEVAEVLAISERSLQRHIDAGRLKASWYHGRRPGPHSGTAAWCIRREDLRSFLRRYPGLIQHRGVDMVTLVDVLAGVMVPND